MEAENKITKDLEENEILESSENFELKPKAPKRKIVISDEERARRAEQCRKVAIERGNNCKVRREKELEAKEERIQSQLKKITEKKETIKAIREKTKPKDPEPEPAPPKKAEPKSAKKPKKAVKVVVEASSSESEDYGGTDSESSSGSEVIYISKSKAKKQPKEKPITKSKPEPSQPKPQPACVFKFV
jgi:hypothetical protein